ncbi:Crp/Fnr family transcriptional regulator [Noviherbaspirillum saxi]|uniref:Transcriptional regulator n=1 Tax=Noviherbaspirillum saxi TaxID=2320863 RepID=A0A3A3FJ02_9BURK|nr:helix-turn-helix domain-containing protein [Noviherbaspirillum saxi]RJF95234.1 transcriptional regulator [Noviherbaspirillum saxi]
MFTTSTTSDQFAVSRSAPLASTGARQTKLWSSLSEVCQLMQVPVSHADDTVRFQHVQFRAGQRIYTIGQPFDMLYVVYSGFLKTVAIDESGNELVLGFPMKGDMFGIDGIHGKAYTSEVVALSTCDVILIPFKTLLTIGKASPDVEQAMWGAMGRELIREQRMISSIGSLGAEARVARFLMSLSDRFAEIGFSSKQFNLRMTRQEIGSYLGLTLETVSRTLSAFNALGLISVEQKTVTIHEPDSLKTLRRLPPSKHAARSAAKLAA